MANDKIILAKLDIDTRALVESAIQTKKEITQLIEQQQKLADKGKETSAQFIVNASELKKLEAAYRSQQAAIAAQTNEEGKLVSQKKAIKQAVADVNQTENEYINNNRELIALKKQLNTTDDDYASKLEKINQKLHENNTWLQENGSAHAKLITTYTDFKQQVIESFDSINIFNGGLGGLISRAQEAGGAGPLLKNAFDGITGGIGGMTKAAWSFVSTPIGAILTALVLVVQGLMAVFKNFTPIMDKVEQVTAAVGAVFESVKNSIIGLLTGATSLGDFFSGFGSSMADAASEAYNLKKAQQELEGQMKNQEVVNEKAKTQIDELIAKSKDMSLSEKERAEALKQATKIEQDNYNQRKKQSDDAYNNAVRAIAAGANLTASEKKRLAEEGHAYAQLLQEKKSITAEEIDALKSAEIKKEQLTREGISMRQKMLNDEDAAKKKLHDDEQKRLDDAERKEEERQRKKQQRNDASIAWQRAEIDNYKAINADKEMLLEEQIAVQEKIQKKETKLLDTQLKAGKISKTEYNTQILLLEKDTSQKIADLAIKHANAEIALEEATNKSKIDENTKLTQQLVDEDTKRINKLRQMKLEELALEKGINDEIVTLKQANNEKLTTKEMEFLAAKARLNEQSDKEIKDKRDALEQVTNEKKAADKKLQYDTDLADATTNFEEDRITEDARYEDNKTKIEERKVAENLTDAQFNALNEEEEKRHSAAKKAINEAEMNNKMDLAYATFGNLATIMGKESAAGKAMAIAQATMDTYKAATSAYSAMAGIPMVGPALGAVAAGAAVAAGIANVKKITSTKPAAAPKAEKGALFNIGGNRHSAGGTMFTGEDGTRFEAEQGEIIGVMNRNAARHFMAFNNTFPAGGTVGSNYFENGGIVSREIAPAAINLQELAAVTINAVKSLPAPVVAVQDIITQGNSYVQVKDSANF
jgi:hypothetical protein